MHAPCRPPLTGWSLLYKCLDFCWPAKDHTATELMQVSTLLSADVWERALEAHPDRALVFKNLEKEQSLGRPIFHTAGQQHPQGTKHRKVEACLTSRRYSAMLAVNPLALKKVSLITTLLHRSIVC